jgi:hypothetical protein
MSDANTPNTRSMNTDACTHTPRPIEERCYNVKDRSARALFNALCLSLDVDASTRSKSDTAPIYVRASSEVHAQLTARWSELMSALDARLLAEASAFVATHCGLELKVAPPR